MLSCDIQDIYKKYSKPNEMHDDHYKDLFSEQSSSPAQQNFNAIKDTRLTSEEKSFLLAVERGDLATVKKILECTVLTNNTSDQVQSEKLNINCVDPLGRSALLVAIEYENIEMIELLLSFHVQVGEALLHAINEEFVEAVEILLAYQDQESLEPQEQRYDTNESHEAETAKLAEEHESNQKTLPDLQAQLQSSKSFTPDITPLVLASHKDNYEIIKILLDRGAQIPEPHDVRCNCNYCLNTRKEDSLRYSKSRLNAYKALASPSLISLSSKDPILTAFQLSWELRRLSRIENEYKDDYEKLAMSCQVYASALLAETRTSKELDIILNHDHDSITDLVSSKKMSLSRLKLAIKYRQKKFVAHPHCQQLLVSLWYEGFSSFRRRNIFLKIAIIIFLSLMFPVISTLYLLVPNSRISRIARQPFIKFICHSASYVTFLILLILTSLRIKSVMHYDSQDQIEKSQSEKRGTHPTTIELIILSYVIGFVWTEVKQLYQEGLEEYMSNYWNILDFISNTLYIATIILRFTAYILVKNERKNKTEYNGELTAGFDREKWDPWDPTLISEGVFAAANILSTLKFVYIFTINPQLGPLQISVGRMIIDIIKFSFFLILVVIAFSCGINQLFWYYTNLRERECRENNLGNPEKLEDCLLDIKNFSNLWETLQTMWWGIYGLVETDRFEIYPKHKFTMFVGLLMFGVYCATVIVVLVNMLIAMMSNSYQIIAFSRSKLWLSYIDGGNTLPTPFSLIPNPKSVFNIFKWFYESVICYNKNARHQERWMTIRKVVKKINERDFKYQSVIKELVKRYIMKQQKRDRNAGVTEDDLNEIKQDISAFRFELLDIFRNNEYKVDSLKPNFANRMGRKRGKINLEKTISKNFFDTSQNNRVIIEPFVQTIENCQHQQNQPIQSTSAFDEYSKKESEQQHQQQLQQQQQQQQKPAKKSVAFHKVVACKLRKFTDVRAKKNKYEFSPTGSTGEYQSTELLGTYGKNVAVTKPSFSLDDDNDTAYDEKLVEITNSKDDDDFTEKITEV